MRSLLQLIKREEFEARKREAEATRLVTRLAPMFESSPDFYIFIFIYIYCFLTQSLWFTLSVLSNAGYNLHDSPLLQALAEREGPSREGELTVGWCCCIAALYG